MKITEGVIAMHTCCNCQHWSNFSHFWTTPGEQIPKEKAVAREAASYRTCILTLGDISEAGNGALLYYPINRATLAFAASSAADGVLFTRAQFGCNQFQSLSDRYAHPSQAQADQDSP
jgi:hypothetical protein